MRCLRHLPLVAGERLAVNAMRTSSLLTKSFDAIGLVSLKIATKPGPLFVDAYAGMCVTMRSEPAVVAGYHRASWEALRCILKAFQRLNIEGHW